MLNNQFPLQPSFDASIFEIDPIKQMVNLTKIAKHFNKEIGGWLRNQNTKEFLEELAKDSEMQNCISLNRGNNGAEQGTWGNQEVALEFAQWISPKFKVFCIKKLSELFNTGKTSLAPTHDFSNPNTVLQLAQNWKDECDRRQIAEVKVAEQEIQLLLQEPKVEFHDEVMKSEDAVPITIIAKELGWSATKMNSQLVMLRIQYKVGETYVLHAKHQNMGYTKTKTHTYVDNNGKLHTTMNLVWTQKGRYFIHETIKKLIKSN